MKWSLSLLSYIVCVACIAALPPPRNGGMLVSQSGAAYHWSPDSFPIPVFIDSSLSLKAYQEVVDSCNVWNAAVRGQVFNCGVPDEDAALVHVSMGQLGINASGNPVSGRAVFVLHTDDEGNDHGQILFASVYLDLEAEVSKYRQILSHELGHVLGLDHDNDKESLMYPSVIDTSWTIQPEDIRAVRAQMMP